MKMFGTVLVEFESDTEDPRELVRRFMKKYWDDSPEPGWIFGETVDVDVIGACKECKSGVLDGDEYRTQYNGEDDEMFCMACWAKRSAELEKLKGAPGGAK